MFYFVFCFILYFVFCFILYFVLFCILYFGLLGVSFVFYSVEIVLFAEYAMIN